MKKATSQDKRCGVSQAPIVGRSEEVAAMSVKPTCSSLRCNRKKTGFLTVGLILLSASLHAGNTYSKTSGTWYYDDLANWGNPTKWNVDNTIKGSVEVVATNGNALATTTLTQLRLAGTSILRITDGGVVKSGTGSNGTRVGSAAGSDASLLVEKGGTYTGALHIGYAGKGTVKNSGTYQADETHIGAGVDCEGFFVHDGGENSLGTNPKKLFIGEAGKGELQVLSGTFKWWDNQQYGGMYVGCSQAGGVITIEENASMSGGYLWLGGHSSTTVGCGELVLKGGSYINVHDNGSQLTLFNIGTAPDESGAIATGSFGAIRGWGAFSATSASTEGVRSVCAKLGYGVIEADGGGDETHVLKCGKGLCKVSNALSGAITESGWRATNKGAVYLPGCQVWGDGYATRLTGCIGCETSLAKPDLVNSVRIDHRREALGNNSYVGVMLLDPTRSDAHADKLPTGCNVLSVHRIGTFKNGAGDWTDDTKYISGMHEATIDFRYDQTKILRPDSRLELWRYTASTDKWMCLAKIAPGQRPVDCVISTPSAVSPLYAETFNYGTFAIVERQPTGLILVVR